MPPPCRSCSWAPVWQAGEAGSLGGRAPPTCRPITARQVISPTCRPYIGNPGSNSHRHTQAARANIQRQGTKALRRAAPLAAVFVARWAGVHSACTSSSIQASKTGGRAPAPRALPFVDAWPGRVTPVRHRCCGLAAAMRRARGPAQRAGALSWAPRSMCPPPVAMLRGCSNTIAGGPGGLTAAPAALVRSCKYFKGSRPARHISGRQFQAGFALAPSFCQAINFTMQAMNTSASSPRGGSVFISGPSCAPLAHPPARVTKYPPAHPWPL